MWTMTFGASAHGGIIGPDPTSFGRLAIDTFIPKSASAFAIEMAARPNPEQTPHSVGAIAIILTGWLSGLDGVVRRLELTHSSLLEKLRRLTCSASEV